MSIPVELPKLFVFLTSAYIILIVFTSVVLLLSFLNFISNVFFCSSRYYPTEEFKRLIRLYSLFHIISACSTLNVFILNFVSPTGEHFLSCKEASSFLKSHFEDSEKQLMDQRTGSDQPVYKVDFGSVS